MTILNLWCWFWGDTPGHFFFVEIESKQLVADLKEGIIRKHPKCSRINPIDLDVFKVSIPTKDFLLKVEGEPTPHHVDGARILDNPQDKIEDLFDVDVYCDWIRQTIDVIVMPSQRSAVCPSNSFTFGADPEREALQLIYELYWGKEVPVTEEQVEPDGLNRCNHGTGQPMGRQSQVLRYIAIPGLSRWGITKGDKLMVRDEYVKAYDWLSSLTDYQARFSVICGHPDIGKTLFLYYCLVQRLSQKSTTSFSLEPRSRVYILSEKGVHKATESSVWSFDGPVHVPSHHWALLDAGTTSVPPPSPLVYDFRVVLVTSPDESRYRHWVTKLMGLTYYMNPWSWDELWVGASIQYRLDPNTPSAKRMLENYLNYGPSPRIIYEDRDGIQTYNEELEEEIEEIDLDRVLDRGESLRDISNKLFVPYPALDDRLRRPRFAIASRYILGRLAYKFDGDIAKFKKFADRVTLRDVYPETMAREVLYEVRCHRTFVLRDDSSNSRPMALRINKMTACKKGDAKPHQIYVRASVWQRMTARYSFQATPRTVKYFSSDDDLGTLSESTYYIPRATIDPAYDAFVIRDRRLFVFKMSVALGSLRVNVKGLEDLKNRVGGQVIGEWYFVMVVPPENEKAAEVVLPEEVEWASKLSVFTLVVPELP
ncbi:hypothetical protein BDN72DRAFT_309613 [Pluteus cervinus]|uniref:Uncharacterized protein n=1 Tax=Pluteus cervinus TaxID=181527 RepID=A0ACD3ADH2_9AGAR|nr:hypothetical protein BDN72DRAFT_309613 [Pluteus cervinus]